MGVAASMVVWAQLSGVWTALTDVRQSDGLKLKYGVFGNAPTDCLAGVGDCQFALRNDAGNSGGVQGYYSPLHASKRAGWQHGIPLKVVFSYAGTDYTKFRGKVSRIAPEPGQYKSQRAFVLAHDGMLDLLETNCSEVALQVNKTESELVAAALDSLPVASQPVARSLDTGVDIFPYAFDDLGGGVKAATLLKDVLTSAFAFGAIKGDGTLILRSRHTRATGASAFTFNNTMVGLETPSDLNGVFNLVTVKIRPKTPDAAATTVLYSMTGTPLSVSPGQTTEIFVEYRDPYNTKTLVGGLDVQAAVGATDYAGNSQVDGLGSNLTASLSVVYTPWASSAKMAVTNNHPTQTVFLVNGSGAAFLQIRGKGVYDRGPQTYQKYSVEDYGTRELPIELRYQADGVVAQSWADFVHAQVRSPSGTLNWMEFIANESANFMTQALAREPGDIVTVTETVTGVSMDAVIHSVELRVTEGPWIVCRWGLAPAAPFRSWVLGEAGRSELGDTTVLGF